MRVFFTLFLVGLSCFYRSLWAQEKIDLLDQKLEVRNFKFEQNIEMSDKGSKGIMFSFECRYPSNSRYLLTYKQQLSARKYGQEVFNDSSSYLVLKPNEWQKRRRFVAYRNLAVAAGPQEEIEFIYEVPGLLKYRNSIAYTQPQTYSILFQMEQAEVKRTARLLDPGSPKEGAPDVYWTISSNGSDYPVYSSKLQPNSYEALAEEAQFFALEGEELYINFYDEDGLEDDFLGRLPLAAASKDLRKSQKGEMFGQIKRLNYTIGLSKRSRQPISTYIQDDFIYEGRRGVKLVLEYFLPKSLRGQKMRPDFIFSDVEGKKVKIPLFYSLVEGQAQPGELMELPENGRLSYFIPHYAWNSSIKKIEFYFDGGGQNIVEAAPYIFLQPLEFPPYMYYSGTFVEEDVDYEGAKGIKISFSYAVKDVHQYSKLRINFENLKGQPLVQTVYPMQELPKDSLPQSLLYGVYEQPKMKAKDSLAFFIPYLDLDDPQIRLKMSLVPDLEIPIINERSPLIERPDTLTDLLLEEGLAMDRVQNNDFGYVVTLKAKLPRLYRGRAMLLLDGLRNGVDFIGYNTIGEGLVEIGQDSFALALDSSQIHVLFPYRRLLANEKVALSYQFVDRKTGEVLLAEQKSESKLPKTLHNVSFQIDLQSLKWMTDSLQLDSAQTKTNWKYEIMVGNEVQMSKTLPALFKGKTVKEQFKRSLRAHREDRIQIYLEEKTGENPLRIPIWSGDLGQLLQAKGSSKAVDQSPLKKAKIKLRLKRSERKIVKMKG